MNALCRFMHQSNSQHQTLKQLQLSLSLLELNQLTLQGFQSQEKKPYYGEQICSFQFHKLAPLFELDMLRIQLFQEAPTFKLDLDCYCYCSILCKMKVNVLMQIHASSELSQILGAIGSSNSCDSLQHQSLICKHYRLSIIVKKPSYEEKICSECVSSTIASI